MSLIFGPGAAGFIRVLHNQSLSSSCKSVLDQKFAFPVGKPHSVNVATHESLLWRTCASFPCRPWRSSNVRFWVCGCRRITPCTLTAFQDDVLAFILHGATSSRCPLLNCKEWSQPADTPPTRGAPPARGLCNDTAKRSNTELFYAARRRTQLIIFRCGSGVIRMSQMVRPE